MGGKEMELVSENMLRMDPRQSLSATDCWTQLRDKIHVRAAVSEEPERPSRKNPANSTGAPNRTVGNPIAADARGAQGKQPNLTIGMTAYPASRLEPHFGAQENLANHVMTMSPLKKASALAIEGLFTAEFFREDPV
ncbi:MAG: hypothetical protein Q9226_005516 [Calogaya cf. arnoldii]